MTILVPPTRGGKVDGFIDDLINVFLDTPENCARQPHVVPLAMHVTSRPHAGDDDEPLPRRPILSAPKLIAEGSPAEVQVVLGWRIDTRRLEVSLPEDKLSRGRTTSGPPGRTLRQLGKNWSNYWDDSTMRRT